MIHVLIVDNSEKERKIITRTLRDTVALLSNEQSKISACDSAENLMEILGGQELLDVGCVDVEVKVGTNNAETLRNRYPSAHLILIVGKSQSPLTFIRPSIRASALVIRPIEKDILSQELGAVINAFVSHSQNKDDIFVIDEKEGVTNLPYNDICFFEARSKKIYVRLKSSEYGFYATLDELAERLPKGFLRCHRGFIVNMNRVKKYSTSENLLYVDDGIVVPISRSYKPKVREWLYEKNK